MTSKQFFIFCEKVRQELSECNWSQEQLLQLRDRYDTAGVSLVWLKKASGVIDLDLRCPTTDHGLCGYPLRREANGELIQPEPDIEG